MSVVINSFIEVGNSFKSITLEHRPWGAIAFSGNKNAIVHGKVRTPSFMRDYIDANANVYKLPRSEPGELFRIEICGDDVPVFTQTKLIVPIQYVNFKINDYHKYAVSFTRNLNADFKRGGITVFFPRKADLLPMSYGLLLRRGELFTNDIKKVVRKVRELDMDLDKFVFVSTTGEELNFEYKVH